jgi:hypothetical protein
MQPKTLNVRAVGTAMVPHFESLRAGRRRFVGRQLDPSQGEEFVDDKGRRQRQAVFVETDEPETVPNRAEYREALLHGDLEPADEETARAAGMRRQLASTNGGGRVNAPTMKEI